MIRVPHEFKPLLQSLIETFHRPSTARRFVLFFLAALLTVGDRTVSNVLRLLSLVETVNPSTYHRLFSHRRWQSRPLAYVISKFVVERFVPVGTIKICGDETVDGHRGKKVYGRVFVRDLSGTHRDEYFYTTDISMSANAVIEMYGGRWNIETTFQEMREHLGLETTRGWNRQTVLRMAPCLFCLYTLTLIFFDTMPWSNQHVRLKHWAGKEQSTFSDMISSVRRYLWMEWIFAWVPGGQAVQKLSQPIKKLLDLGLAQAA